MAAGVRSGFEFGLWAILGICILVPFVSPLVMLAASATASESTLKLGANLMLFEIAAAPFVCGMCLAVGLAAWRMRRPALALFSVFGIVVNLYGLWIGVLPKVAG